jgi:hypothetical protein
MSKAKYSEIRKKQPGGRYAWGVLQMEGRKQKFQTVGEGEVARRKAKKLAQRLNQIEKVERAPTINSCRGIGPASPYRGSCPGPCRNSSSRAKRLKRSAETC